jgi:predicted nucleotidyltransferase
MRSNLGPGDKERGILLASRVIAPFPFCMSPLAAVPWAVTPEKVDAVVQRLIAVARPRKIILFGSYVRGEVNRDSDLDVLVVTADTVVNPRAESVRLRDAVDDIDMPMDILVVPVSQFNTLRNTPGLIYREACEHGRLAYEQSD